MQTDEEVGKVAAAVPIMIYILLSNQQSLNPIHPVPGHNLISPQQFSLTAMFTSYFGTVCRVAAVEDHGDNECKAGPHALHVPHATMHHVRASL